MKKVRFKCQRCNVDFVLEILEPGEAEAKRIRGIPPACPKCGGCVKKA